MARESPRSQRAPDRRPAPTPAGSAPAPAAMPATRETKASPPRTGRARCVMRLRRSAGRSIGLGQQERSRARVLCPAVTAVDWIILAFAALMAVWGYAQGLIVGALSLAGFVGGAFLGPRIGH